MDPALRAFCLAVTAGVALADATQFRSPPPIFDLAVPFRMGLTAEQTVDVLLGRDKPLLTRIVAVLREDGSLPH